MKNKLLSWKLCLPLLLGLLVTFSGVAARADQTKDVEEFLWWLPDNTETVGVTRGLDMSEEPTAITSPVTHLAYVGLGGVKNDEFLKQLQQVSVAFTLTASRNFRPTKAMGLMPYEGCSIIKLQSGLPAGNSLEKWLVASATRKITIDGQEVLVIDQKLEQNDWHFLIVQLRPDVILCATNRDYLQSVLRRRNRSAQQRAKTVRALPAHLAEWKYIDKQSDEWAVRRFRREQAHLDPTSPLHKHGFFPDAQARGIAYSLNKSKQVSTLHYLTSTRGQEQAASIFRELWGGLVRDTGYQPKPGAAPWPLVAKRSDGVVEVQFDWNIVPPRFGNAALSFGLFALLGHAIVV